MDQDIDEEFVAFLLQHPGVVDVIGRRLYAEVLPDDVVYPAVAYRQMTDRADYRGDGCSSQEVRLLTEAYASKLSQARDADNALRAVLSGFRGNWGGRQIGSVFRVNNWRRFSVEETRWQVVSDYLIRVVG